MSLPLKPEYIRSDNGCEFISAVFQFWLPNVGTSRYRSTQATSRKNGYNERFNGTLRNEVLTAEWFTRRKHAQTVINMSLKEYNLIRPYQSRNMHPPKNSKSNQSIKWRLDRRKKNLVFHSGKQINPD